MNMMPDGQAAADQSAPDLPLRLIRLGLIGLAGLTPLLIVPGLYEPVLMPQSLALQVGALALLGVAAMSRSLRQEARQTGLDIPLVLFLCWSALSLLWAHNRQTGGLLLSNWLAASLIFWLAYRVLCDAGTTRRLLSAFFIAAGLVASLGILQFFFDITWVPQSFPPAGTLMNKNLAAELVVIALPFSIVPYRAATRLVSKIVILGAVAVSFTYLFLAFSRAAWLALIAQVTLLAFATIRSWRLRVFQPRVLLVALAGAISLVVIVSQSRIVHPMLRVPAYQHLLAPFEAVIGAKQFKADASTDASVLSIRTRLAVWRNTLEMIKAHPMLGIGIGNHAVVYPRFARAAVVDPMFGEARQLERAHNEPLQTLAELGLPGLLLAAWMLVACWRLAVRRLRQGDSHRFGMACALALAGLTITGFVGFPLRMPASLLVCAIVVTIIHAPQIHEQEPRAVRAGHARVMRVMMGVVALLGLVIAVPRHASRLAADRHVLRAIEALNADDFHRADQEAARALSLDPRRKEALFTQGTALLHIGRPLEARAALEEAVRDNPYDLPAIGNLAAAYVASAEWSNAVSHYQRVVDLVPEDAAARHNLAVALERAGRSQEAFEEHRRAAQLEARQTKYRLRYAVAALRLGRLDEAERTLREILEEQPDAAMAHKMLGVLLFEFLGRRSEGRLHLKRALELDPGISDAQRMRRLLQMRESQE